MPKKFHLNGHMVGFHPWTEKVELRHLHVSIIDSRSERIKSSSVVLNGLNLSFSCHVDFNVCVT